MPEIRTLTDINADIREAAAEALAVQAEIRNLRAQEIQALDRIEALYTEYDAAIQETDRIEALYT